MTVPTICMNSQYAKVTTSPGRSSLATTVGHWKQQQQKQQQVQQQQQLVNNILVQPISVQTTTVVQPRKVRAQEASTSGFVGAEKLNHPNIATIHMTPTTDTPLRRSEVGIYREGARNVNTNLLATPLNDDDEERRQARRRTMLQSSSGRESMFEDNETLKKCLEIYNGNKLSKDNAWSLSLIDTLSTLLDRHHKSLNNFKVSVLFVFKFKYGMNGFLCLFYVYMYVGGWLFIRSFVQSLWTSCRLCTHGRVTYVCRSKCSEIC